jgi:hypothetical protein
LEAVALLLSTSTFTTLALPAYSCPISSTIGVSFNGDWPDYHACPTAELLFPTGIYTHHAADYQAFNFHFKAEQIVEGWNEIVVYNNQLFYGRMTTGLKPGPEQRKALAICVVSIELAVKPQDVPKASLY